MKLSNCFFENKRCGIKSSSDIELLINSGMIYKYDNSTFFYMPMGYRVLNKLLNVIKEEHDKYNSMEVLLPSLINNDIFKKSNRNDREMFKIISKEGNHLSLCPTHEELFSVMCADKIRSYKDLHFTLYQISNKYRDENKLSFTRKEEFMMCDSYSFDSSFDGLNISYDNMFHVYNNILNKLNINYLVCESDPYSMNGVYSEEVHYICDSGSDEVVKCSNCTYTANHMVASVYHKKKDYVIKDKKNRKVYTPYVSSISDVAEYLHVPSDSIIKTMIYKVNDTYKLILMRGLDQVNEVKLRNLFKSEVRLASDEEIEKLGGEIGFIGPINTTLEIIADNNVKDIINGVCGSNEKNYHYINITPGYDFKVNKYADLKIFDKDDLCPICKSKCNIYKTMEIGNLFKLGTKYSDIFNMKYSDEENNYNKVYMGSYGIGVERLLYSVVSANRDDRGINFPMCVAPYLVSIIVVNMNDREAFRYASTLYNKLINLGIDTILDDRKVSAGVKFKDNDLIGIPVQIIVGYMQSENKIEFKLRNDNIIEIIDKAEVISKIQNSINLEN